MIPIRAFCLTFCPIDVTRLFITAQPVPKLPPAKISFNVITLEDPPLAEQYQETYPPNKKLGKLLLNVVLVKIFNVARAKTIGINLNAPLYFRLGLLFDFRFAMIRPQKTVDY